MAIKKSEFYSALRAGHEELRDAMDACQYKNSEVKTGFGQSLRENPGDAATSGHRRSQTSPDRWHVMRLRAIAAAALMLGWPGMASAGPVGCTTVGTTATCTGNQSGGITTGVDFLAPPVTTLNVNALTANIAPPPTVHGISFINLGTNAVAVSSATGLFRISTSNADGVNIYSPGAPVTLVSSGAISASGLFGAGIMVNGGGAVSVNNTGDIFVSGLGAVGISAYNGAAAALVVVRSVGNITVTGDQAAGIVVNSVFTPGSTVNLSSVGNISVTGLSAVGISAQGIDDVVATSVGNIMVTGAGSRGISAGNFGGSAPVSVTSTGNITAAGGGDGINARSGAAVSVVSDGIVSSTGAGGRGIVATSFGAGAVTVATTGTVNAPDTDSTAIMVTSATGNIAVTAAGGVTGGSGTGAGVSFAGGANNNLTNTGTIASILGTAGNAIIGTTGNEVINNSGTVTGAVDLGAGANTFNNMASGVFNTGATIQLGSGNVLTNSGILSPGGTGAVTTTALTGNLVQTAGGRIIVDVNSATGQADRLNVSGSANLAGLVTPRLQNLSTTAGAQQYTILSAALGASNNGLTATDSTAVVTNQVSFPNATDVVLNVAVNYAPTGLNQNQTSIGQAINAIQAPGSAALPSLAPQLATLPDAASLAHAYDQLSPEVYLKTQLATLASSIDFAESALSCRVRDGAYAVIREGQCFWVQAGTRLLRRNTGSDTLGFTDRAYRVGGGMQLALSPNWHVGFALAYERDWIETSQTNAKSRGDIAHAGVSLKFTDGPLLLAASFSGGYGSYDVSRPIAFGSFLANATSNAKVGHWQEAVRAAWVFDLDPAYVKPLIDVRATHISLGGLTESNGNGADLTISGKTSTVYSASPAVEFGFQWTDANQLMYRPRIRVGASFFSNTTFSTDSAFTAAPAGGPTFRTSTNMDRVLADVAVGIDVMSVGGAVLSLYYAGQFGATTQQNTIGAKASLPF